MTGYQYHYSKAKMEFVDWFYKGHDDRELAEFWFSACGNIDDMLAYDDELRFALDAFDECEQVKILWHYERRDHCLKIKWEVNPWWNAQVLHFYYCIMLPIDSVKFKTPHELVTDQAEEE